MKRVLSLVLCLLSLLSIVVAQAPTGRNFAGVWRGTLDISGIKLRLAMTLSRADDGSYKGSVDSIDQGAVVPIDLITENGDSIRIEMNSVAAIFEATLSNEGTELSGKFSQGPGAPVPLVLKRETSAPSDGRSAQQRLLDVPVEAYVRPSPILFKSAGKHHVAYELHLTNFSRTECELTKLEILGGEKKHNLATHAGAELVGRVTRPGTSTTAMGLDRLKIGPGLRAVVFLWASFDKHTDVPSFLTHRMNFKVGDAPDEMSLEAARAEVQRQPLVVGPPLRG